MLRVESESGWWLITHQEHARLAAEFASHWGNELFASPVPRTEVLDAIRVHDDGWAARDARPEVTRQGKPSAFSQELVGKYSAFEEIDLADYLSVREKAVTQVQARSPYAALLVSMHTYNLLTERADRSTIADLELLDAFLQRQLERQDTLRSLLKANGHLPESEVAEASVLANFRLLQATDNLSLLGCVGYMGAATLLHPLATRDGLAKTVDVISVAPRIFRLQPYPFDRQAIDLAVEARHVEGKSFRDAKHLRDVFSQADVERLSIAVTG